VYTQGKSLSPFINNWGVSKTRGSKCGFILFIHQGLLVHDLGLFVNELLRRRSAIQHLRRSHRRRSSIDHKRRRSHDNSMLGHRRRFLVHYDSLFWRSNLGRRRLIGYLKKKTK
jgi:hypothetical protein